MSTSSIPQVGFKKSLIGISVLIGFSFAYLCKAVIAKSFNAAGLVVVSFRAVEWQGMGTMAVFGLTFGGLAWLALHFSRRVIATSTGAIGMLACVMGLTAISWILLLKGTISSLLQSGILATAPITSEGVHWQLARSPAIPSALVGTVGVSVVIWVLNTRKKCAAI